MNRRYQIAVALFALAGVLLSGYLSYSYYWGSGCSKTLVTCATTGPQKVLIFGQPTCVYGFVMFLAVFVLALASMVRANVRPFVSTIFWLSVVGVLFSGGLSVYEIFIKKIQFSGLPACVYGLLFYLGALISVGSWRRKLIPSAPAAPNPTP